MSVSPSPIRVADLDGLIGSEIGVSGWVMIDQARIDAFAEVTGDHQWIHVDAQRAERESTFGGTIAHGLLTLSLLPTMREDVGVFPTDLKQVVNYGYDRIRFIAPVPAGSRVRTRVGISRVDRRADGHILLTTRNTVEIEGKEKPALIADALSLLVT